jgi:hypothetical protein
VQQELQLGQKVFKLRCGRSEITGNPLTYENIYCHVWCSHVLAKGPYPKFRLYSKNIVLMSAEEHHLWEFHQHKIQDKPEWQWVFKLQELLKQEYYQTKGILSEVRLNEKIEFFLSKNV